MFASRLAVNGVGCISAKAESDMLCTFSKISVEVIRSLVKLSMMCFSICWLLRSSFTRQRMLLIRLSLALKGWEVTITALLPRGPCPLWLATINACRLQFSLTSPERLCQPSNIQRIRWPFLASIFAASNSATASLWLGIMSANLVARQYGQLLANYNTV